MSGPGDVEAAAAPAGVTARLGRLRTRVRGLRGGTVIWRVGITVVGVAVIIVGVVLLPLPGPGWLIIFGGLGLLATEYAWADRLLRKARQLVGDWTRWVLSKPRWVSVLVGAAGLLLIAAVIAGSWFMYDLA